MEASSLSLSQHTDIRMFSLSLLITDVREPNICRYFFLSEHTNVCIPSISFLNAQHYSLICPLSKHTLECLFARPALYLRTPNVCFGCFLSHTRKNARPNRIDSANAPTDADARTADLVRGSLDSVFLLRSSSHTNIQFACSLQKASAQSPMGKDTGTADLVSPLIRSLL